MTRRGSGSRLAVPGLTGFIPDSIYSIGSSEHGAALIPRPRASESQLPWQFLIRPSTSVRIRRREAQLRISYAPCQARSSPLRA